MSKFLEVVRELTDLAEHAPKRPVRIAKGSGKWRNVTPLDALREFTARKVDKVQVEVQKRGAWTLAHFCELVVKAGGELLLRGGSAPNGDPGKGPVGVCVGVKGDEVFLRKRSGKQVISVSFDYLSATGEFALPIDYSIDGGKTWLPCVRATREWEALQAA
jgi:hypothetical protein